MLIATAGHVDHGKTTLVGKLTGVDTDRLPEEKKRGVSIDLGFAYAQLDDEIRVGFIDVPGHEKFVRNMLAGVGSIDLALLVVAADDGPMPQTREHLSILSLLGVQNAAIVLTRIDLVEPEAVAQASAQCQALVADTPLRDAPVFPVSSVNGDGIDALKTYITQQALQSQRINNAGRFRLAVDRQFSIAGSGLVVTGTVFSGKLSRDESVILMPQGKPIRVRELRVQDEPAQFAQAGDRCALNLNASDLGRTNIERGNWLTGEPEGATTQRVDVELTLLASEQRPLAHWAPAHLHWAAGSTTGRIALLGEQTLAPGQTALAQLVLDDPWLICAGDRIVLRDQSAQRTIAGAVVIAPFGPVRGRAQPARIALLNALRKTKAATAIHDLLPVSTDGLDPRQVADSFNLSPAELAAQLEASDAVQVEINVGTSRSTARYVDPVQWAGAESAIIQTLTQAHQQNPDMLGLAQHDVIKQAQALCATSRTLVNAALSAAVSQGLVKRNNQYLHLTDHRPVLSEQLRKQWEPIAPHLSPTTLRPMVVSELAKTLEIDKSALQTVLLEAAERGLISRFAANRFFHPEALIRLAHIVETLGNENPDGFDARQFRDASQIGRNLSIEVLEYFDTQRLTRRIGDKRVVIGNSVQLFGAL